MCGGGGGREGRSEGVRGGGGGRVGVSEGRWWREGRIEGVRGGGEGFNDGLGFRVFAGFCSSRQFQCPFGQL